MSLRSQVVILLLLLSLGFVAMTYGVQTLVVMPTFADLERKEALRDLDRCANAIGRDIELLSHSTLDWSAWDDMYQYVEDRNARFLESTLNQEAFRAANVNLLAVLDQNHRVVWGDVRDISTLAPLPAPDVLEMIQKAHPAINLFQGTDASHAGLLPTSRGPLLFASRPIVTSKNEGPIRGSMILGRFLTAAEVQGIAERTHIDLALWDVSSNQVPLDVRGDLEDLPAVGEKTLVTCSPESLHAYTVLDDLFGQPLVLLRAALPREVTAQGSVSARLATVCSLVGGLVTLGAVGLVLRWRIVGPLRQVSTHAVRVGRHDDLKARLNLDRSDEIGVLAREFDSMVASLAESRKRVLDTAHRAGMAEIASEVLHNVGNAVTSANCSIEVLEDRLRHSKLAGLQRAAALLREQAPQAAEFFAHDPRGAKLIEYLVNLCAVLQAEQAANQSDAHRLRENVAHVRDAIAAQQTFAGRSDFRQEVDLAALVDGALQLNFDQLRAAEIQVQVDLPPLPELLLNKSQVTQVLVNLIRNAIQAMQDQPTDTRRLTITAYPSDDGGLEMEVRDTGHGFSAPLRDKVFAPGFTTKPTGNGLGLHYCANAVQQAGGRIWADSPGPGQGATFRMWLPRVMPAVAVLT